MFDGCKTIIKNKHIKNILKYMFYENARRVFVVNKLVFYRSPCLICSLTPKGLALKMFVKSTHLISGFA